MTLHAVGTFLRRPAVLAGLLVVAIALAYANSLHAPFVFDDRASILDNPSIRQLWPLTTPLSPPAGGRAVAGRPLVNLSLALNYAVSGDSSRGYHLGNVALHAAAALLLFGLARRALSQASATSSPAPEATTAAWLLALLWALHPLLTESVTGVIQRTELLGAFFILLTLFAFALGWRVLSVVACLAGLAAKETVVVAPLFVLLYDRTFVAGSFAAAWRARRGYYAALASTWLLLAWLVLRAGAARGSAGGFGAAMSSWHYLLQQTRAILLYLRLVIWPHPLVVDYGSSAPNSLVAVWPQALVVVLLLVATSWALVRRPRLGFLAAAFFLLLAPSSSVVPLPAQTIAEHRMYLPLATMLALLVVPAMRRWPRGALAAGVGLALIASGLTVARNQTYRSELALWTDTVAHRPDNPRAQLNLAAALIDADRLADALPALQRAEELQPNLPGVHANLCLVYLRLDRPAEAVAQGEAAVELDPADTTAWLNLTLACRRTGDSAASRRVVDQLLKRMLPDAALYLQSGNLAVALEDFAAAEMLFRRATELAPDLVFARANLANILLVTGRTEAAIAEYEKILRAHPDDRRVRENLARAREIAAGR